MSPRQQIPDDENLQDPTPIALDVMSGVSAFTAEAYVQVVIHKPGAPAVSFQMTPDEARRHGAMFFEVAEAADHDAITFEWAKRFGLDEAKAAMLLDEFRGIRTDLEERRATS